MGPSNFDLKSRDRGDIQIRVGEGTFPAKEISVHSEEGSGGHLTYHGYFVPYPLTHEEIPTLNKVQDQRIFRIILKSEGELPFKCKTYKDTQDMHYFNATPTQQPI